MDALPREQALADPKHQWAMSQGAQCHKCPLLGCRRGPVQDEVRQGSLITFVGEAPGRLEVEEGGPFRGPSGFELELALDQGGVARHQTSLVNTILCQPPPKQDMETFLARVSRRIKRGEPIISPIEACKPRLTRALQLAGSKVLHAVGARGLEAMCAYTGVPYGKGKDVAGQIKSARISRQRGAPIPLPDGRVLTSSMHPAYAMRKAPEMTQVIRDDIAKACQIALRDGQLRWNPPPYNIFLHRNQYEAIAEIERLSALLVAQGALTTTDVETNALNPLLTHVRCAGFRARVSTVDGGSFVLAFTVPFHYKSGKKFWSSPELEERARLAVKAIVDGCPLVMHNGLYDTAVYLVNGMMENEHPWPGMYHSSKLWIDTALAHHCMRENDLPHRLDFVASRLPNHDIVLWKGDADHKVSDNVERDNDLHIYNLDDCEVTGLAWDEWLSQAVFTDANLEAFKTDTQVAPIARSAGLLGLFGDEKARGIHYTWALGESRKLVADLQEHTGRDDFNPGSTDHVAAYLFDELGYEPQVNTDGKDFEEGDSPTTNMAALLELKKTGMAPRDAEFVEKTLQYRALDKIRGTYVAKPPWQPCAAGKAAGTTGAVYHPFDSSVELLPARDRLSHMQVSYRLLIPTGRWSSSPNCLDKHTELLTEQGWISIVEYAQRHLAGELLPRAGAFNPTTRQVEWQKPRGAVYHPRRALTQIESHAVSICGTGDHRLLYWDKANDTLHESTIDELPQLPRWASWVHTSRFSFERSKLWQREQAKIEALLRVLERADWFGQFGQSTWALPTGQGWPLGKLVADLKQIGCAYTYEEGHSPVTGVVVLAPENLCFSLEARCLVERRWKVGLRTLALVEPYLRRRTRRRVRTDLHVAWLQSIAFQCGVALKATPIYPAGSVGRGEPEHYELRAGEGATLCGRGSWARVGEGEVGCVGVRAGFIVTRRHGKVVVVGNCQNIPAMGWMMPSYDHTNDWAPIYGEDGIQLTQPSNLRKMYVAPPGHVIVGADFKQIDLRMYAADAEDVLLIEVFDKDMDAHTMNAASLMSKTSSPDEVMQIYRKLMEIKEAGDPDGEVKKIRTVAKFFVFALVYGASLKTVHESLLAARDKATNALIFPDLKEAASRRYYSAWHRGHPETKQWQRRCAEFTRQYKYSEVPILDTRKRWFEFGAAKENAIPNVRIQGGAAAIMTRAVLAITEAIPYGKWSPYTGLAIQVHDYAGCYVPESRAEEAIDILTKCMPFEWRGVRFEIDPPKATKSWGDQ